MKGGAIIVATWNGAGDVIDAAVDVNDGGGRGAWFYEGACDVNKGACNVAKPLVPSFRALSRRLKFTVRRNKFNKDSLSRRKDISVLLKMGPCLDLGDMSAGVWGVGRRV